MPAMQNRINLCFPVYKMNLISSFAFQGKPSTAKLAKEECSKAYQPEETYKLQLGEIKM